MNSAKAFTIPKAFIWKAYQDVKRSQGGPGADGQTMEDFESDLKNQLYKIWNRMSSGSYFPPPVLRVDIPKSDGGTRPGRSALDAVAKARQRCWRDNWVLDLDISKFFDALDHGLVMRAVRRFTSCNWVLLYIERWLKANVVLQDGTLLRRDTGTPQGGVISPLIANIFLHLGFDQWMEAHYPNIHFERYADDIVVHCRSKQQLEMIKLKIKRRLEQCKLRLNPEKTRIVYCKDSKRTADWHCYSFDFLGYPPVPG
jgi:RNA-directed DNA polymerase